jgi:hypothetical protein
VVDEELVQVRERADPVNAEETGRRPGSDSIHEPREVVAFGEPAAALLGEALERSGQDDARAGEEVALAQHDVRGEIVRAPTDEQGRCRRAEFLEDAAKVSALRCVEVAVTHLVRARSECVATRRACVLDTAEPGNSPELPH